MTPVGVVELLGVIKVPTYLVTEVLCKEACEAYTATQCVPNSSVHLNPLG